MGFDRRDIRSSMDVYTLDNIYLGTVLKVIPEPQAAASTPAEAGQSSSVSGELLGPMPTATIGNSGPETQSARARYAAAPDGAQPLGRGTIEVGRWWGVLGRRAIPLDNVQTVSLERVVLRLRSDEIN